MEPSGMHVKLGGHAPVAQRGRGDVRIPWRVGGRKKLCGGSLAGWRPPRFLTPVLSPGGEGHWRNAGAGLCPEAASGAPSGCRSAEPGLHEVLAGSGGGGGHASEGRQGPGPAKPEVPPNPDPCAHRSTAWQLSPKPASDPHLSPCHGPILGPAASPWASPCPCGSPSPSLCTRRCPASTCPGPGLEKDRTLAPEQREEPEQCQGTVGAAPKSVYRIRACVPVSLSDSCPRRCTCLSALTSPSPSLLTSESSLSFPGLSSQI